MIAPITQRIVRSLLATCALAAPGVCQAAGPDAPYLEYVNAADAGAITDMPRLAVIIGNSRRVAVMDTGSTGVVLAAASIPDIDALPQLGPGQLTYSSSGRIMRGRWVRTPLEIAGQSGSIKIKPIPVLAVEAIECTPDARRCTPDDHPTRVAMLGIGFGRGGRSKQPGTNAERNPMLNLDAPANVRRSYMITRRGIRLGDTGQGFTTVKLTRNSEDTDWMAPPACIALDQGTSSCGTALVDTGITGMFLTVPAEALPAASSEEGPALVDGTTINIDLMPSVPGRKFAYAVKAGDASNDVAPTKVTLSGIGKRPTYVNTGVRLLNRFDYFYDAEAGLAGYRERK